MSDFLHRLEQNKIVGCIINAIVMTILAVIVYIFNVPNPNMILITVLIVFASIYGYSAGIISGAIMIIYSMFFFSKNHSFIYYEGTNIHKLIVIIIGVILSVVFIGQLHDKKERSEKELLEINQILRDDNISLEAATTYDSLTGVKNRFAMRREYDSYRNQYVHVMILDVDDFKSVNDNNGHMAGDRVLSSIGSCLADVFGNEHCYRYGGDEFVVLYPDISEEEFQDKLSTFKQSVSDINKKDNNLDIQFSAGYTHGKVLLNDDLRFMIRQADDILYKAKKKGKDQYIGEMYSRKKAVLLR